MAYNFDKQIQMGKWNVQVDTQAKYGYFEHDDMGEGGGLWFDIQDDTKELELTDYDGVYELPTDVKAGILQMDINVSEDF